MNSQSQKSILVFRNSERRFGIMLEHVREVLPAFEINAVPGVSDHFVGLISLRGEVLPVMDAARLSGDDATELHPHHQFIIVRSASTSVAILVEDVVELVERGKADLEKRDFLTNGLSGMHGVFLHEGHMVMLIDLEALLVGTGRDIACINDSATEAIELGSTT